MLKLTSVVPWRAVVTVLITVIVLLGIGLSISQSRLRSAQENVGKYEGFIQEYAALVARQNAGIEALKAEGQRRVEKVIAATKLAAVTRATSDARAQAVLSSPAPSTCEYAITWGIGEAQKLNQGWR